MDPKDRDYPPDKLNESYIETALFALFKINLVELIKIKVALAKQFHIQPSEIDKMQHWEYEIFIRQLNDLVKDENDRQKSEMDKYHVGEYMNMARPGNINKMMSNAQPKIPNMNVSIPTVQTKL